MDNMNAAEGGGFTPLVAVLLLTRWIHFVAVFALFGSALFWTYMPGGFDRARAATDCLLRAAAPVAALSGLGWLAAIVANMAGGFDTLSDPQTWSLFFFETQFGPVAAVRLTLLGAGVVAAAWPEPAGRRSAALMAVGALLLINQAWLGHAAEGGAGLWGAWMILVYAVHVLAAAAWLGGLPALLFVLREADASGKGGAMAEPLRLFSLMALPAVVLIAVSGAGNVGFRVGSSFGRLFMSDYGAVLCVKAALVAAMLALAAFNRFVALSGLRVSGGDGALAARLRVSVLLELALGAAVLAAAALLGITPPPQ